MEIKHICLPLLMGALSLCASIASCSRDDLLAGVDDALPPGHPLEFTASVEGMASRAGSKEMWLEDDEIGIRLINRNNVKYVISGRYKLNSEGTVKEPTGRFTEEGLMDSLPLEWPYTNGTVTAWFPFEPQIDIPIGDQSGGIYKYDYLYAEAPGKRYTDVIDLQFRHRMAKVTCRVLPGDGITPEEFSTLWLKLQGYTTCSVEEREFTGKDLGWITPDSIYSYADGTVYEALLVPEDMEGKDLINLGIKVTYNLTTIDKLFEYPSPEIEAGKHYTYNILVKKDRIEVTFFSGEWNDKGAGERPSTPFTFTVNLSENLVKELNVQDPGSGDYVINSASFELVGSVTPVKNDSTGLYDKLEVTGNEFTVNVNGGPDTRSSNLVVKSGEATNDQQVVYEGGKCYKQNKIFLIADETTLDFKSELNVGDYFFSDGSWSSSLGWNDVQCIGIVFAVNNGDDLSEFKLADPNGVEYVADKASDYVGTPISESNQIRGYVLALKDAIRIDRYVEHKERVENGDTIKYDSIWYKTVKKFPYSHLTGQFAYLGEICSMNTEKFDGFSNVLSVKSKIGEKYGPQIVPEFNTLEAFKAAEDYGLAKCKDDDIVVPAVAAPPNTSGWYLPSIRQIYAALFYFYGYENPRRVTPIEKAGGDRPSEVYWASTLAYYASTNNPGAKAYNCNYNEGCKMSTTEISIGAERGVRAILTF